MKTMTARDLKNNTGEAMRAVLKGEKVFVTLRGKPFALISPATETSLEKFSLCPFEDSWKGIEETLKKTAPKFKNLKETMSWTRRR